MNVYMVLYKLFYSNATNSISFLALYTSVLAPILGVIVLLYMTCDCFCKVCCSGLMQTVILSCAEVNEYYLY